MKTIKNRPRLILLTLLSIGIAGAFSSCKKDDTNSNDAAVAHIKIVNAAEGSSSQELYLDNAKVNASAVAYTQSSDYVAAKSGSHQAKFTNSGSTTANASFGITLNPNAYYTLYYTSDGSTNSGFATQDDMTAPESGKAKVRFVHLSSAAASTIDIGISGAAKIANNLAYKTASAYYTVDANTTFLLYAAGSVDASLNMTTTVQAGKIYTIYISGTTTADITYHVIAQN